MQSFQRRPVRIQLGDTMDVVPVDIPCPVCNVEGQVGMMTHVDEIPYFGEHTQVTVLCNAVAGGKLISSQQKGENQEPQL